MHNQSNQEKTSNSNGATVYKIPNQYVFSKLSRSSKTKDV